MMVDVLTAGRVGVRRRRFQRRLHVLGKPVHGSIHPSTKTNNTRLQLTDWLAHVPKEVIAKNFQTSISAFDHIPAQQLYIFPSSASLIIRFLYTPKA